jgi:ppGpp synthetase/RelA/SpoT-type nucleotidyltranferase
MSIREYREKGKEIMNKIFPEITEMVKDLDCAISCRLKSEKSIKEKMKRKNLRVEELNDIVGFRIVGKREDFNEIVKRIYKRFNVVDIEDFFSNTTELGYKAIHLVVNYQNFKVEIQIHTNHTLAFALLCHDLYKKKKVNEKVKRILASLKKVM